MPIKTKLRCVSKTDAGRAAGGVGKVVQLDVVEVTGLKVLPSPAGSLRLALPDDVAVELVPGVELVLSLDPAEAPSAPTDDAPAAPGRKRNRETPPTG